MPTAAETSRVLSVLARVPDAREVAALALVLEDRRCVAGDDCPDYSAEHRERRHHGRGFEWHEVGTPGHVLARLVTTGLLAVVRKSRAATEYALTDVAATREALAAITTAPPVVGESTPLPDDLLSTVVGLDEAKQTLRACLEADAPVHPCLVGGPASAKSLMLAEIARLPGALQLVTAATTGPGLREVLFAPEPPRYLIVDEAEKGRASVLATLLKVLEEGLAVEHVYGRHREAVLRLWGVFAVNRWDRLDAALRSRLWRIELPAYDVETRRQVIAGFLVSREGADPELAQEIATLVAPITADVRRARDIARLCRGDRRRARDFAEALRRQEG